MDDFSSPNASNYFGLVADSNNYPEPYKRPLSSMSPSILLDTMTGKVRLVGGASGGPKIITGTVQVGCV
jgi:gamma-glutamyltranspeptidase